MHALKKADTALQSGYSLPQAYYNDANQFKVDIEKALSMQWQYVDHESVIPNPGDFITYEFANESVIIVRTKSSQIKAHFNVCRHRGSRICDQTKGRVAKLVCPYHAWVFDLDGKLQVARQMPEGFRPEKHGLHSCDVEVLEGLIFVRIAKREGADFAQMRENLRSFIKPHDMPKAKIAHTQKYVIDANWKLVIENFRECYHCSPSHPEYTSVNEYVKVGDKQLGAYQSTVDAWCESYTDSTKETGFRNFPYALQPHHAWRMPIKEGYKTASQNGQPVAPLMGEFEDYDGAETVVFWGVLTYFYFNNDYATAFRVTPISANETHVQVTWFVDQHAEQGKDYEIEKLIWLWDVTTVQDAKIVNENQIGVNSSRYSPGPYSEREYGTADFVAWYIAMLEGRPEQRVMFRK